MPVFLELAQQMISHRTHMALRPARGDHHMVGQCRFSCKINGYNFLGQVIIETFQNQFVKGAVYLIGSLNVRLRLSFAQSTFPM